VVQQLAQKRDAGVAGSEGSQNDDAKRRQVIYAELGKRLAEETTR
jgi:hypothetical protein